MDTPTASCPLLQAQLSKLKTPFIIGIAGDSGSGKTIFSDGIRKILGPNFIRSITMDGYHKENREQRAASGKLPLDPNQNKLDLVAEHLRLFKQGAAADVPQYNHATGDFDAPKRVDAAPIMILEGLHTLYPQFLDLLDLKIYVDPDRDVKWQWKFARDVEKRGHRAEKLEEEMLARESAYKRWIDFQKVNADIVIKISHSHMAEFARYDFINALPSNFYKVELIMKPSPVALPSLALPFDLSQLVRLDTPPFLLAATSCRYWGESVVDIHMDGAFSQETLAALEAHIAGCTSIPIDVTAQEGSLPTNPDRIMFSSTDMTQLLVAWRFLEAVNHQLLEKEKQGI